MLEIHITLSSALIDIYLHYTHFPPLYSLTFTHLSPHSPLTLPSLSLSSHSPLTLPSLSSHGFKPESESVCVAGISSALTLLTLFEKQKTSWESPPTLLSLSSQVLQSVRSILWRTGTLSWQRARLLGRQQQLIFSPHGVRHAKRKNKFLRSLSCAASVLSSSRQQD